MGDFSGFSVVGPPSFLEDRSCFGEGNSSSEVVFDFDLSVFDNLSAMSCNVFRPVLGGFLFSSPGIPSISAHWSGGGVGCFLSSSAGSDFCGTNGACEVALLML